MGKNMAPREMEAAARGEPMKPAPTVMRALKSVDPDSAVVCCCEATIQPDHIGNEPFFGVGFPDVRLAALRHDVAEGFIAQKTRETGRESEVVVGRGGDPALANLEGCAVVVTDALLDRAEQIDDASDCRAD